MYCGPSKGGPVFSKLFRLDRTDPRFSEILVEWIAPELSCLRREMLYFHVNSSWKKILMYWAPTWPPCHEVALNTCSQSSAAVYIVTYVFFKGLTPKFNLQILRPPLYVASKQAEVSILSCLVDCFQIIQVHTNWWEISLLIFALLNSARVQAV